MWVNNGATATLKECAFVHNAINDTYDNSAVLTVAASREGNVDAQQQDTIVRLEQCNFTNNIAQSLLTAQIGADFLDPTFSARIFSDVNLSVVILDGNSRTTDLTEPLSAAIAERLGITSTSLWLRRAQQVRSCHACSLCPYHFSLQLCIIACISVHATL
jgi:hypothetical protein